MGANRDWIYCMACYGGFHILLHWILENKKSNEKKSKEKKQKKKDKELYQYFVQVFDFCVYMCLYINVFSCKFPYSPYFFLLLDWKVQAPKVEGQTTGDTIKKIIG